MTDYAISAVGRSSGDERLTGFTSGNEAVSFEDISNRQSNSWGLIEDSGSQVRILQEPSPADGTAIKAANHWDDISSRIVGGIDNIRGYWRNVMKEPASSDKVSTNNNDDSLASLKRILENSRKQTFRVMMAQCAVTMTSSVGTTIRRSISILYRQQG